MMHLLQTYRYWVAVSLFGLALYLFFQAEYYLAFPLMAVAVISAFNSSASVEKTESEQSNINEEVKAAAQAGLSWYSSPILWLGIPVVLFMIFA